MPTQHALPMSYYRILSRNLTQCNRDYLTLLVYSLLRFRSTGNRIRLNPILLSSGIIYLSDDKPFVSRRMEGYLKDFRARIDHSQPPGPFTIDITVHRRSPKMSTSIACLLKVEYAHEWYLIALHDILYHTWLYLSTTF